MGRRHYYDVNDFSRLFSKPFPIGSGMVPCWANLRPWAARGPSGEVPAIGQEATRVFARPPGPEVPMRMPLYVATILGPAGY
jgi:hypothetical protein